MLKADKLEEFSSVKIKEYGSSSRKVLSRPRQKGSILIGLIVTMVVMASLGAGMFYLTTTSTFQELFANNHARAYYAAESGGRYALSVIRDAYANATDSTDLNTRLSAVESKSFTMTNGDQFQISALNTTGGGTGVPATIAFNSTGIVSSGFLQAKRQISYSIQPANQSAGAGGGTTIPIGIGDLGAPSGSTWGGVTPGTGDNAGAIKVNPITESQDSGEDRTNVGYTGTSLADNWRALDGLSYDAQVKVRSSAAFFLAGLAFRNNITGSGSSELLNSFYVSFLRSSNNGNYAFRIAGNENGIPGEITNFVTTNDTYIVLWMEEPVLYSNSQLERIIAFKKLPANSGVFTQTVPSSAVLTFWQNFQSHDSSDRAYVELSMDDGATWPSAYSYRYDDQGNGAKTQTITLPSDFQNVKVRFRLYSTHDSSTPYWYIDDVAITVNGVAVFSDTMENSTTVGDNWPILNGWTRSSTFYQSSNHSLSRTSSLGSASTSSPRNVLLTSKSFSLKPYSFTPWSTLLVRIQEKTLPSAMPDGRSRVNDIMVYYGTQTSNLSGGHSAPTDDKRTGGNLRDTDGPFDTANWPGTSGVVDTSSLPASNEYFTLVQWDWVRALPNQTTLYSSGTTFPVSWTDNGYGWPYTVGGNPRVNDSNRFQALLNNTIVRTTYNTTPASGTWPASRQEVGLNAFGNTIVTDGLWFDDFAVKIGGSSGGIDGSGAVTQY